MDIFKNFGVSQNVQINVYDEITNKLVQRIEGHNSATNSMLTGIAHYLIGEGILNQGWDTLGKWIPQYISLGTMGLYDQEEDEEHLPAHIGSLDPFARTYGLVDGGSGYSIGDVILALPAPGSEALPFDVFVEVVTVSATGAIETFKDSTSSIISGSGSGAVINYIVTNNEKAQCIDYLEKQPGYGADGYSASQNNYREFFGIGPTFDSRPDPTKTTDCELILTDQRRPVISFRNIIPESSAEIPKTVDIVFSAMISTGQLKKFRESDKDYIFITEAGLWANPAWQDGVENGCLAAYRITYHDQSKMTEEAMDIEENRKLLKQSILRVGVNQVVQVVWKIQLGSIDEFGGRTTTEHVEWHNYYDTIEVGTEISQGTYIRYHDKSYIASETFNKTSWDNDITHLTLVSDEQARWNQG